MRRDELQFDLPPDLIAQRPATPRDASRLLVLHRDGGRVEHRRFRDLGDYLEPGDCLACNDTRVIPARFFCTRRSGGRIEALFLRAAGDGWRVLLKPSARLKLHEVLACQDAELKLELLDQHERGEWTIRPCAETDPIALLQQIGQTPLPPYIRRPASDPEDSYRYQTLFARDPGAVAAPTAGLHFSERVLAELREKRVARADLTLHVGLGTFSPITVCELADHVMHSEWFRLSEPAAQDLCAARRVGRRIVAIGTTSARVLESLPGTIDAAADPRGLVRSGWTDIFLFPPYAFRNVDALLTNFHLPESTLLALVMAFGGIDPVRHAYRAAIERRYRFYSYGDALLVL